jgi:hypothetical protein
MSTKSGSKTSLQAKSPVSAKGAATTKITVKQTPAPVAPKLNTPKKGATTSAPNTPKKGVPSSPAKKAPAKRKAEEDAAVETTEDGGDSDNMAVEAPKTTKARKPKNPITVGTMKSVIPEMSLVPLENQELALEKFTKLHGRSAISSVLLHDAHDDEFKLKMAHCLDAIKTTIELIVLAKTGQPLNEKKPRKPKATAEEKNAQNEQDENNQLSDAGTVQVLQGKDEDGNDLFYIENEDGSTTVTDEQGNALDESSDDADQVYQDTDEQGNTYYYKQDAEGNKTVTDDQGNELVEEEVVAPPKKLIKQANGVKKASK